MSILNKLKDVAEVTTVCAAVAVDPEAMGEQASKIAMEKGTDALTETLSNQEENND